MSDFRLLATRKIIPCLIGDDCDSCARMPYLSTQDIKDFFVTYEIEDLWSNDGKLARWSYMQTLMIELDKRDKLKSFINTLLRYERFETTADRRNEGLGSFLDSIILTDEANKQEINKKRRTYYQDCIAFVLRTINCELAFQGKEFRNIDGTYIVVDSDCPQVIASSSIKVITNQYVRELPNRIQEDLLSGDYDSVVSKSRLLVEETCIYILEQMKIDYNKNGDVKVLREECKKALGMKQCSKWDKRINDMVSGLNKIIDSVGDMRNSNSDAHGVGSERIEIKDREAKLVANATVALCEYFLDVYNSK